MLGIITLLGQVIVDCTYLSTGSPQPHRPRSSQGSAMPMAVRTKCAPLAVPLCTDVVRKVDRMGLVD